MAGVTRRQFLGAAGVGTVAWLAFAPGARLLGDPLGLPTGSQTYPVRARFAQGQFTAALNRGSDDLQVLRAIGRHLLGTTARFAPPGPSSIAVIDQTASICQTLQGPRTQPFCASVSSIQALYRPARGRGDPPLDEVVRPAESRDALVASFTARNRSSERVPLQLGQEFVLVPATAPSVVSVRQSGMAGNQTALPPLVPGGLARGYIVMSLPGYSSTNHAMAYAFYDCAGRCGTSYMYLFEKADDEWKQRARYIVGQF
jgi:hypothetical protein